MPPFKRYASAKQERWANSSTGRRKLGLTEVAGKNAASKGASLPETTTGPKAKKKKGGRPW